MERVQEGDRGVEAVYDEIKLKTTPLTMNSLYP
jgi:hypothetical protein